jgi:hypothetical protein
MLILHGTYSWWRRIVAYRNDYCLTCSAERMAFQHRTFDVHHVFWIPILPLGLWKRWHCTECGQDPHASPRTRKSLKWAGVACLAFFTLSAWMVSPAEKPEDTVFIWVVRLAGPLATAWAAWATARSPAGERLKEKLRGVRPLMDTACPLCRVTLFPSEPAWHCPQCGIRRTALRSV